MNVWEELGLIRSRLSDFLTVCSRIAGRRVTKYMIFPFALRIEKGVYTSATCRRILSEQYAVHVGAYSYGPCMSVGEMPRNVRVGRYVSMARGIQVFLANHPIERMSLHPFFYEPSLGVVDKRNIDSTDLEIGHDTWIGANAIILPKVRTIGIGAVIAAGSVVTKSVPDFAIVAGNPAKLVRYRFCDDVCERIRLSRWWECSIDDCRTRLSDFLTPVVS